jgi:hypothetical protein
MKLVGKDLAVGREKFKCIVHQCGKDEPDAFVNAMTDLIEPLPTIGRRAIKIKELPGNLTLEAIVPSEQHAVGEFVRKGQKLEDIGYGKGIELDPSLKPFERGKILHTCFEVLSGNPGRLTKIGSITGYEITAEELNTVSRSLDAFDRLLTEHFKPVAIMREEPFLALNEQGSVISGVIDLLVETEKGFWVIDHKSDKTDDLEERLNIYLPQVQLYAEAVRKARPEKPVLGAVFNWITYGKLTIIAT